MDKKIGYELIIKVNGFDDARRWIYALIEQRIVKCGQCDQPATHVFWQDQAEWYCRCGEHREHGQQWTGSTSWRPVSFGLNVIKDTAADWLDKRDESIRKRVKLVEYDATDYYALMYDDFRRECHYLVGGEGVDGAFKRVDVYPLKNGEYAYEITKGHQHQHGGSSWSYGVRGAWETEALALDAAKAALAAGDY